jgi:hypothetical protein
VPYAAVGAAIAAIVFLLPSALRPPQSPPTQTAELSPDAPPDDNQDSLISTLNRGHSGTGDGTGENGEGPTGAAATVQGAPPTTLAPAAPPAACPFGYGRPPRQTFSIYSPPCAAAFTGSNGGATSTGVTATEIRVVVHGGTPGWADQKVVGATGSEGGADKTWRLYEDWLNSHYQFYGRRLRLYKMDHGSNGDAHKAAVAYMANEVRAFAAVTPANGDTLRELARQKIIGIDGREYDDSFLEGNRPYIWSWAPSATIRHKQIAEYVCAKLADRPAAHAGPAYQNQTRKFGLAWQDEEGKRDAPEEIQRFVRERCGVVVEPAVAIWTDTSETNLATYMATAVAKLQSANATSVILAAHVVPTSSMLQAAGKNGYIPEWILAGEGGNDQNANARTFDPTEWAGHAFGISPLELEEPGGIGASDTTSDGVRAYKEMDPGGSPDGGTLAMFPHLMQLANGIQMAGPTLTPQTFERGMFSIPLREGPPNWARSGGYRPGNHGYATAVGEIWWDPRATDSTGSSGAYRWTHEGRRWRYGQIPPGETTVFSDGISSRPEGWSNY